MNVFFSKRYLVVLACILSSLVLLFSFQNCAQNFQSGSSDAIDLSSTSASAPPPAVELKLSLSEASPSNKNAVSALINATNLSFHSNVKLECKLDSGNWAPCLNPVVMSGFSEGSHLLAVRVFGSGRDLAMSEIGWLSDRSAPVIQVSSFPAATVSTDSFSFVYSGLDNLTKVTLIECSLDGGAFMPCASPYQGRVMSIGPHNLKLRATDEAGNRSNDLIYNWKVEVGKPVVQMLTLIPSFSNQRNYSVAYLAQAAAPAKLTDLKCFLNDVALMSCVSPLLLQNLTDGAYRLKVTAQDDQGFSTTTEMGWVVDTIVPTVSIDSAPPALTNANPLSVVFSGADLNGLAGYECSESAPLVVAWKPCMSPYLNMYAPTLNFSYAMHVRATDRAGNVSQPASVSVSVDRSSPTVNLPSALYITTNVFNMTFTVSDNDQATMRCYFAGVSSTATPAYQTCGSPLRLDMPSTGQYVFSYNLQDRVGNSVSSTMNVFANLNSVPPDSALNKYSDISFAGVNQCVITSEGTLKCGSKLSSNNLVEIDSGVKYKSVSGDIANTCAIVVDGKLKCWGANDSGQIGDGTTIAKNIPVEVDAGVQYASVSVGGSHACAITVNGDLKCWGYNSSGQVGDATQVNKLRPVLIGNGAKYKKVIASSTWYTCGLETTGLVKCWGDGRNNVIGDGVALPNRLVPTAIATDTGETFIDVSISSGHACVVNSSHILKCWGKKGYFYGDGIDNRTTGGISLINLFPPALYILPTEIDNGVAYKEIFVGLYNTCGLTLSNSLRCWGFARYGQLGVWGLDFALSPIDILTNLNSKKIVLSNGAFSPTCFISDIGVMKCTGYTLYLGASQPASSFGFNLVGF